MTSEEASSDWAMLASTLASIVRASVACGSGAGELRARVEI